MKLCIPFVFALLASPAASEEDFCQAMTVITEGITAQHKNGVPLEAVLKKIEVLTFMGYPAELVGYIRDIALGVYTESYTSEDCSVDEK